MKSLFYFPTLVLNFLITHLTPRWAFRIMYTPQSEEIRAVEQQTRNTLRKTDYYAKKALWRE